MTQKSFSPFIHWESEAKDKAGVLSPRLTSWKLCQSDAELCSGAQEERLQKNQSSTFSLAPCSLIPFHPTRRPGRSTQPWPTCNGHFQECPVNAVLTLGIWSLQRWGRHLRFVSPLLSCSHIRGPQQVLKASIRNATATLASPPPYQGTRLHFSWNITTV